MKLKSLESFKRYQWEDTVRMQNRRYKNDDGYDKMDGVILMKEFVVI